MGIKTCEHVPAAFPPVPKDRVCEDCVRIGGRWVHLRMCLHCGHVGCCDNSPNKHASKHFALTGHPVMRSIEPGEDWRWCYEHERQVG
ncbi:UBP-type zinc finger domain-containing protein [Ottowia sp.]|uniref:UBP-type zinc finger domain-containing protein n=1 Tax=Ottowia sp. TaxID=1898956 RepID=UPI0025D62D2A|nr:UBP-type zinc finger domain-containing protein [Ottowia sp.]MBK6745268.1 UBP-type zinc finger domain-containing protein [Ottowia sp.]